MDTILEFLGFYSSSVCGRNYSINFRQIIVSKMLRTINKDWIKDMTIND